MKTRCGFLTGVQVAALSAALAFGVTAQQATAADPSRSDNLCLQTNYTNHNKGQTLGCTSNDVRIARVTNIRDLQGNPIDSCIAGSNITFQADYEVDLTAQDRYDIGLYLATDGDLNPDGSPSNDGALRGKCTSSIITGPSTSGIPSNAQNFINLDPSPDVCGDITGPLGTGTGKSYNPQMVHMVVTTLCIGDNSTPPKLKLPNCTSWRQPGSNEVCTGIADAYPGSPSKCNCDKDFTIAVNVEHTHLTVTKSADPTKVNEPGGSITYNIRVTNPASFVSVTLGNIVDDPDNNKDTDNSITYTPSSANCTKTVLKAGEFADCSFTQSVSGNPGDTITDQVCVSGTDSNTPPSAVGPNCDTATVTIVGVLPSANLITKVTSAVATFEVKVQNTSTVESLLLQSLCDDTFGAIATSNGLTCAVGTLGAIKSTTCSLPQTLAINGAQDDTYTCTFVAEVGIDGKPCTDPVTGTVLDNDGNSITPSGSATVTITQTHNP